MQGGLSWLRSTVTNWYFNREQSWAVAWGLNNSMLTSGSLVYSPAGINFLSMADNKQLLSWQKWCMAPVPRPASSAAVSLLSTFKPA